MLNLKNTLDGYLKNVEVIGNTVQDINNLANIRSVGDKVDGQDLYKIDIASCGKNLFDGVVYKEGGFYDTDGRWASNPSINTYRVRVNPNTTYIKSGAWNGINAFFDKDMNFISGVNTIKPTTPNNCYYMTCSISANIDLTSVQLEEGTVATPYEPYKENKLEILSPVQLEKVGDVADRIIYKDGVWGIEKNVITYHLKDFTQSNYNGFACRTILPTLGIALNNYTTIPFYTNIDYKHTDINFQWNNKKINSIAISKANINGQYGYVCDITSENYVFNDMIKLIQDNDIWVKYALLEPQFIPLPHDQQVKLRTFAGQTNIAFLTEISGQIKAQVPKSLGATVNTHTEQIADLHNSLDRVKKLEETTVSTVETGSNFTTVDATSNGYFEDVKLEGKTLVNLYSGKCEYINKNLTYTLNQSVKSNTVYTMVCKAEESCYYGFFIPGVGWEGNGTNQFSTGYVIKTITSINGATASHFRIHGATDSTKVSNFMLLEGDHTNNPPSYFEGLMSVGQDVEEVSVASCDFIDITEFESGGFNGEGYPVENGARVRTSNYIPYANTKLKLGMLGSQEAEIVFYNKDKTKLSNIAWVKDGDIVAVPNNTQYVRVALRYPNDVVIYPSDIKYFKMSCTKDKKPLLYFNPTTETWEKPILREWDTIEKHSDGKYYYHKRSGEVVLNGGENGWGLGTNSTNTLGFIITHRGVKQDGKLISTTLKKGSYYEDSENIHFATHNGIYIRALKSKLTTQDVAGFKAWLNANPITVVYELLQEEVYECTNIDLMTYSGETNYIINSGAISPKSLLKVHNNISNVVKILQEKVSLLENTFIAGLKSVLSGDMYSLATILYPEDFEQNDNTEQDIMVIPE